MKKVLIVLFLGGATLFAAKRMVVGELLTSTTCPPCVPANHILDGIATRDSSFFAVIRYHTWWPGIGNDPFWHNNEAENRARNTYYHNNYVPHFFIDGKIDGDAQTGSWAQRVLSRASQEAPLSISLNIEEYDTLSRKGKVTATIENDSNSTITGRLFFVLTETGIHYNAPNGEHIHNQVMLDMMPSASGKQITIQAGKSITESQDFEIKDTIWLWNGSHKWPSPPDTFHLINPDSCQIVAFVQNYQTKEIYQGAKVWVKPAEKPQPGIQNQRGDREVVLSIENPVNSKVRIKFQTRTQGFVTLKVYNANGELVYNLAKRYNRGTHQIFWNGKSIPQGIYFISLKTPEYRVVEKVVVLESSQ